MSKQAFMNKKKLFTGSLSTELKKENSKDCVVECDIVSIRNIDNDSNRPKEIRSHRNVDLEKDGENYYYICLLVFFPGQSG